MRKRVLQIILIMLGTALIVAAIRAFVATSYLIPSTGMENTLYRGERIIVNKWSYGLRLPGMAWWGYHRWGEAQARKDQIVVFNNPGNIREPVISRREIFIGRCTAGPGDTLMVDSFFNIAQQGNLAPDQKWLYVYPAPMQARLDSLTQRLGIPAETPTGADSARRVRTFSRYEYYLLTQAMAGQTWLRPLAGDSPTTMRPLVVPAKGMTVDVDDRNRTLLCNTLVLHEHRKAFVRHDTLFVDGRPVTRCQFTKDYYWVTSNNTANPADSRLFGFVPQDHLIGRATVIWYSRRRGRIGQAVR